MVFVCVIRCCRCVDPKALRENYRVNFDSFHTDCTLSQQKLGLKKTFCLRISHFFLPSEGIISKSVFEVQLSHYIARLDIKTVEIGSRVEDAHRL